MSEPSRPVPDVTPETEPYWTAAADNTLLIRACQECGLLYHYPRAYCPDCFSEDVIWREATGAGEVYSYSIARSMSGWPEADLPIIVAYVELDEGPRILTNLACAPDDVAIGTSVEVQFVSVDMPGVAVPVFVPATD